MKKKMMSMVLALLLINITLCFSNAKAEKKKPLASGVGTTLPPGDGTTVATTEEEEGITVSADVALMSQYIWRGYELSKDSLVIQPSATVGYKGFSLNLWGNLDTDVYAGPYEGKSKWNETDFTVAYEHSFGPVGLGLGYIYYAVASFEDTQEFYLSVGGDVILAPTLTVYRDVGELNGWYIDFGISHSFELPFDMTLDLAGSFAYYISDNDDIVEYNDDLTPTDKRFNNFQNGLVSIGMTIPFYRYFSVVPMIAYSTPLSSDANNLFKAISLGGNSAHLFGGVTLSVAF